MVIALGIAWVLDGLEITVASAVGPSSSVPTPCTSTPTRWV
ncbi:hypothetical protein [Streptomyces sp. NBC_00989]|nr:hypothetical protein OG714_47510 [Streptomyces sp. NBC_00989]